MASVASDNSAASDELDFVQHWDKVTLEDVIITGSRLRDEKFRIAPPPQEWDVINVDFSKDPKQRPCRRKKKLRNHEHIPETSSPKMVASYVNMCKNKTGKRKNIKPGPKSGKPASTAPKCPLRIIELAVPSKRQFIETWRSKNHVLPIFMVERLRQQIMDETPLVKIEDAEKCFRNKRLPSPIKNGQKLSPKQKAKNRREEERKIYSCVFMHYVSQKLSTPLVLNLNPCLERLAYVVEEEILKLMRNKKSEGRKSKITKKYTKDVSKKVAVWISSILDDTSYKMLLEDLKELEEEEGPVLDLLDELINDVVTFCEPVQSDSELSSVIDEQHDGEEHIETDNIRGVEDAASASGLSEPEYSEEQMKNIIINDILAELIRNVSGSAQLELDDLLPIFKDAYSADSDNENAPGATTVEGLQEIIDQETIPSSQTTEEINDKEYNMEDALDTLYETANNENMPVDQEDQHKVLNGVTSESDDKNKKVAFSELEIGDELNVNEERDSTNIDNLRNEIEQFLNQESTESFYKVNESSLSLAPVNEKLLNRMDEKWPSDLIKSKSSSSILSKISLVQAFNQISKSLMSLGSITEISSITELANAKPRRKFESLECLVETAFSIKNSPRDENVSIIGSQLFDYDDNRKPIDDQINKITHTSVAIGTEVPPDGYHDELKLTEEMADNKQVTEPVKITQIPLFDYVIHPETAPSWAVFHSPEESKHHITVDHRSDAKHRKWIKDMVTTSENMVIWIEWINKIYDTILKIRNSRRCACKEWKNMIKIISVDVEIWLRNIKDTESKLKRYRKYYNKGKSYQYHPTTPKSRL